MRGRLTIQGILVSIVTLRIRDDGPIVVSGPVRIIDAEGNELRFDSHKPGCALCRCGQSAKKPFCDGAHRTCGFSSVVRADRPAEGG